MRYSPHAGGSLQDRSWLVNLNYAPEALLSVTGASIFGQPPPPLLPSPSLTGVSDVPSPVNFGNA
jgi:hypothetical protein